MDAPATVVWMAPASSRLRSPNQARALSSWGRAHGVRFVSPSDVATATLGVDPRIADDVERFLERARDALTARDGDTVDRAWKAASSTLEAHPELPQAAWLRAEVERTRNPRDCVGSPRSTKPQPQPHGRAPRPSTPGASRGSASRRQAPRLRPRYASRGHARRGHPSPRRDPRLRAETVGNPARGSARPGRGARRRARFGGIDRAPAGTSAAAISAPLTPECSKADVARARATGDSVDATGVRCSSWVAAMGSDPDVVRVAVCSADHCGPLLAWHAPCRGRTTLRPRARTAQVADLGHMGAGGRRGDCGHGRGRAGHRCAREARADRDAVGQRRRDSTLGLDLADAWRLASPCGMAPRLSGMSRAPPAGGRRGAHVASREVDAFTAPERDSHP